MHKVVVERPRWNPGRGKKGQKANLPDELLPKFESIKRRHQWRKAFTDLLGPLRRWLQSQTGRPWNDVYSEACKVIKPDSVVRAHIKTHLLQFVERGTFMHNGKVCVLDTWQGTVRPITKARYGWVLFYVHPETGILKPIPEVLRPAHDKQNPKQPFTMPWVRKNVSLQQIRGLWFECHFEVVPVGVKFKAYDYLLERTLSRSEISRHENSYYLCVRKRQLSKHELREHGLHNTPEMDSNGAQSSRRCGSVLKTALQKDFYSSSNQIKTMTQSEKASRFHALHQRAGLFLIPNPWDAGSTRVLAGLGFEALATSSAAAAAASLGKRDGKLSREESLANARSIVEATDLPVAADLENGFGDDPKMAAETVLLAAEAGLVGGSIEDATGKPDNSLYEISFAAERVAAAVQAARSLPFRFTLTARAENFIRGKPDLADTINRLIAYEGAGADVLFAPGLPDLAAVREVCSVVTKPVNFITGIKGKSFSMEELAKAGVPVRLPC